MRRDFRSTTAILLFTTLLGVFWFFEVGSAFAIDRVVRGSWESFPVWFVTIGNSLGEQVTYHFILLGILSFVLSPVLIFVFGYWLGQGFDLTEEYPEFFKALLVTGGSGLLIGRVIAALALYSTFERDSQVTSQLIEGVGPLGELYLQFILVCFAGAALQQFRQQRRVRKAGGSDSGAGIRDSTVSYLTAFRSRSH
ncbi:hypothetical protein [Haladaptatus sp. NG-SE-30]